MKPENLLEGLLALSEKKTEPLDQRVRSAAVFQFPSKHLSDRIGAACKIPVLVGLLILPLAQISVRGEEKNPRNYRLLSLSRLLVRRGTQGETYLWGRASTTGTSQSSRTIA